MNSIQIETLSKQMDINVSAIQEAIECGLQLNIFYEEMKNDLEVFQNQSEVRPSGKIFDFYNPVVEIYIKKIQAVAEVFNNEYEEEYNEECVMLPVIAAFNEIISSDTECEEEISTQEYDDSINYSLYSDDECIYDAEEHDFECFEIQRPLEIEEVKIQNNLEQQPEEKNQILDKTFIAAAQINISQTVLMEPRNNFCRKHQVHHSCKFCDDASRSLNITQNIIKKEQIPDILIDINVQQYSVFFTEQYKDQENICRIQTSSLQNYQVYVRNYKLMLKEDNDFYPIYKNLDYQMVNLKQYDNSHSSPDHYGHISKKSDSWKKIIIDNNLRFQKPLNYIIAAYDIETYDTLDQTIVPKKTFSSSHIGCICLSYQIIGSKDSKIYKHYFVVDREYKIISDYEQHIYHTEQEMCLGFLNFVVNLQESTMPIFLLGYNSSVSLNDCECGYDFPFIYARSNIQQDIITQSLRLKKDENENIKTESMMIRGLKGISNLYLIDMLWAMNNQLSGDIKNSLPNMKLETVLEYYNLNPKLDHNYEDLQKRLIGQSDISDIINYCMRDTTCLLELNEKSGFLDTKLAVMETLNLPLSCSIYDTPRKNLELFLMRLYTEQGYAIQYYAKKQNQDDGFTGAYCDTNEQCIAKRFTEVIQPDFISLYPHCIMANNIGLVSYRNEKQEDCKAVEIVDIQEDNIIVQKEYYYSQSEKDVIAQLMEDLFAQRNETKKLMKTADKDQYMALNLKQLGMKIVLNTTYGLLGSTNSVFYFKPLAESITSFGRKAIFTAKQQMLEMGSKYICIDTDSVMATIPDQINDYKQLQSFISELNNRVQTVMNTNYLVLEIEEVFRQVHISKGKKCYAGLLATGNEFYNWKRDVKSEQTKLKMRSFAWSRYEKQTRTEITKQVIDYLESDFEPYQYFQMIEQQQKDKIQNAIEYKDMNTLEQFAERVKTIGKSCIAIHLQNNFKTFIDGQQYIATVLMKGYGNKLTQRKRPLISIDKNQYNMIDQTYLLHNKLSTLAKLLLTKEQNKRSSTFKMLQEEQDDDRKPDQISLRVNYKKANGQLSNYSENCSRSKLSDRIFQAIQKKQSLHEIVKGDKIRLFFDVDQTQYSDIEISKIIGDELMQCIGFVPIQYILRSDCGQGNIKYHIYYNVTLNCDFVQAIASRILENHPHIGVDIQVYKGQRSLRLPRVGKYTGDEFINYNYDCMSGQENLYLITPYDDHPYIKAPLHFIQHPILDLAYQGEKRYLSANQQDIILLQKYLADNDMHFDVKEQNKGLHLQRLSPAYCTICKRIHDNENMYATITPRKIILKCFADKSQKKMSIDIQRLLDEDTDINQITLTKKEIHMQQNNIIIQDLITKCSNQIQALENSTKVSQRYIDLDFNKIFQNHNLVAVKSQLGTGKSHQVAKYLEESKDNVLIVSHRISYSHDISNRYQGFVLYDEQKGSLYMNETPRIICQIESLKRIRTNGLKFTLILDEIESLLSQLNSEISKKNKSQSIFLDLLQNASKVIVMDGFLQNETISCLNSLRNKTQTEQEAFICIDNDYKPYKDHNITIKNYYPNQSQAIINQILFELNQGKKICSMITLPKQATAFAEQIKSQGFSVLLLTGQDLDEFDGQRMFDIKQNAFQNVNQAFKVDFLCFTSSLTAGVNFDHDWFDHFISIYGCNTCDALSYVQGLFRNRQWKSNQHTIYFQNKLENELPRSPYDILHKDYGAFVLKSQSSQLSIWLQSRRETINYYRSTLTITQLKEMGFTIQYDDSVSEEQGPISQTQIFITAQVDQSMVDIYRESKRTNNKQMLVNSGITLLQAKKIALCEYLEINPCNEYTKQQQYLIQKELQQIKQFKWVDKLLQGNIDSVQGTIAEDLESKRLNMGGIKKIDIAKIKKQLKSIEIAKVLREYFVPGTNFLISDLPQAIQDRLESEKKDNPNIGVLLKQAAASFGIQLECCLEKKSGAQRVYRYKVIGQLKDIYE